MKVIQILVQLKIPFKALRFNNKKIRNVFIKILIFIEIFYCILLSE